MASCRDCIHDKVCSEYFHAFWGHTANKHSDLINADPKDCPYFKVRSRFVELPCHVGDTVYMLTEQTQKLGRKKITKTVIVECCVDNFRIGDAGYPSAALCNNENVWCYGVEPKMFGEIIFLSREEAEQALKERENNAERNDT